MLAEPDGEIRQRGMKMDKKITDEKLKAYSESGKTYCDTYILKKVALAFLAERAERAKNPGVWDGAPDNATMCSVKTWANGIMGCVSEKEYKRELPKTRVREFAEARAKTEISIPDTDVQLDVNELADVIESAIIKYEESIK